MNDTANLQAREIRDEIGASSMAAITIQPTLLIMGVNHVSCGKETYKKIQ